MISKIAIWLVCGGVTALLMEPWAALLHGRLWHGRLWGVHRSHHRPRLGRFERNDLLSFIHAPVAIALILFGCLAEPGPGREVAFGVGLGMTAFGLLYVLVHDGLVHQRLPVGPLSRVTWLKKVRSAHLVHHRHDGLPFGLFSGPWALRRQQRRGPPRRRGELAGGSGPSGR